MARIPANLHGFPLHEQKGIVSKKERRVVVDIENQSLEAQIKQKLTTACQPLHLELINESHMHAGPATHSHFKLVMVSEHFTGLSPVKRHQFVYRVLREELAGPVHALALHLLTQEQWLAKNPVPDSPLCAGKNT